MKRARLLIFAFALVLVISAGILSGCAKQHTHSFNEWHTVKEATCTEEGLEEQECACGEKNSRPVAAKGHKYGNGVCLDCGAAMPASSDLKYSLSSDGTYYTVTGIGTCTDTDINIPATYNGKPVTGIDTFAFDGCTGLTSITFKGTKEQWNAVKKGTDWNTNTGKCTIHCTDGDITK